MIDKARRGYIYTWNKSDRPVLVVSGGSRESDRIISILVFGEKSAGSDVITIHNNELGDNRHLHCFLPTYVHRDCLIRELGKVPDRKMELISEKLATGLGLDTESELARAKDERDFYHERYNELFGSLFTNGKTDAEPSIQAGQERKRQL